MSDEKPAYFYNPLVTEFQVLLEEVTRAKPSAPDTRFVEPDAETFSRLTSRFHHALLGRRGTGKSSLLRKMESSVRQSGSFVAWTDQETFSALSYPDVLVATLAEVFRQFAVQLRQVPIATKRKWFGRQPLSDSEEVALLLDDVVVQLIDLKNSPGESNVEWTASYAASSSKLTESSFDLGLSAKRVGAKGARRSSKSENRSQGANVSKTYAASKTEHLERAVTTYRDLMKLVSSIRPDAFVILDDFYRLSETVQPDIAGYFHRVVKDTSVWLKFGSIPF